MVLFKRIKKGDPLNQAVCSEDINKVYDILEGLTGRGCSVEKSPDGKNWTIVVGTDGEGNPVDDETDPPDDYKPPDEAAVEAVSDALGEAAEESGDPDLAAIAEALSGAVADGEAARNPPPCGNPLNKDDGGGGPPLDGDDGHNLDYTGYGGYSPKCADDD